MKVCCFCKLEKGVEQFYRDKRSSDGLQSRCKPCYLAAQKTYPKNRGSRKEYLREYIKRSPEKLAAIERAYKEKHPDKYAEIQRNYRTSAHGRATALLNGARRRAKEKRLECTITREWIAKKIERGFCELTNMPFDMTSTKVNRRRPYSPSIDRINNNFGYTPENSRVVLSAINIALNEWGDELFSKIVAAYLSFSARKNKLAA